MAQWVDARDRRIQRLDLEAVDADDRMAIVHQMVCEREAGGTQADDQHAAPGRRLGVGPAQIERVRAFYRQKRAVTLDALEQHFSGRAQWTPADGGLFTFLTFNDDIDTAARVERAVANGVAYVPGAPFFVDGSGRNTMRLTFAKEPDERLREGVERLARVFGS